MSTEPPMIGDEAPKRSKQPHAPLPTGVVGAQPELPAMTELPRVTPSEDEDPRIRAARRAAELREHGELDDDGVDKFYIDPAIIPPGWSYEWKTLTVLNQPNPAYQVSLARKGWEAVPSHRHPELMPIGWSGGTIERDGLILMERPMEITQESRRRELHKARSQVSDKEQQITSAPAGDKLGQEFATDNKGKPIAIGIRKSYEAMEIPK